MALPSPTVLIQTVARDTPALIVAAAVERLGGAVAVHAQTGIIGSGRPALTLSLLDDARVRWGEMELSSLDTIWNRRFPSQVDVPDNTHPADREFLDQEARSFLRVVGNAHPHAVSVNPLAAKLVTTDKFSQLRSARAVGLTVPATLMTNDAIEVRAFARAYGPICAKPFSSAAWRTKEHERLVLTATRTLSTSDLANTASIELSPSIYQAYVDKAYEVRITAFGSFTAAIKIDSQALASTAQDWRQDTHYLQHLSPIVIPADVAQRLRAFLASMDLMFGIFDFIIRPDGEWVFLEVNEAGQFTWQETYCPGCFVIEPFARFLLEPSRDFTWSADERSEELNEEQLLRYASSQDHLMKVQRAETAYYREGIGVE